MASWTQLSNNSTVISLAAKRSKWRSRSHTSPLEEITALEVIQDQATAIASSVIVQDILPSSVQLHPTDHLVLVEMIRK
uniref:Uncharacterized protein n=1 Tax=Noccaea caerulescens TaxID=107243 RepID=A0A1J3H9Z7_NOCCA